MTDEPTPEPTAAKYDPQAQLERAQATIFSIMSGGDLSAETLQLSNEFTDATVERVKQRLRRPKG